MNSRSMKAMLALFSIIPSLSFCAQLTLNDYLTQVEGTNQGIMANKLVAEATLEREEEGKLIFKPSIFASAQSIVDKKPVSNPATQGSRTDSEFATVGLMQNFNFGLQGQLGYTVYHTKIYKAAGNVVPLNEFNDGNAKIELSQSLWRNWKGREYKAQSDLIDAQTRISKHIANFTVYSALASAESIYWSLSQTRKVIKVQEYNLSRAQQIRSWNKTRANSGLSEKSDLLQADSNLRLREYELQSAIQKNNLLQRTFNSMRGIDSNLVDEELDEVVVENLKKLAPPVRSELREDTKAALEQQNLAKANAALAIEKIKPRFELFGSYAFNGRDAERGEAILSSFSNDHTTSAIGVRFNAPLDFSTTKSVIDSYKKEQMAAEYNYQRKFFDQDREWNDLLTRFEDAKVRLDLTERIAAAQRIKTANERSRLNNGRTTTFQVLIFELDSAQSEILKIETETDVLNIFAQLKIFSAGGAK